MRTIIAAAAATLLLAAGCATNGGASIRTSPTAATTTTAAAAPTAPSVQPLTKQQAADLYLRSVEPVNRLVGAANAEMRKPAPDMAKIRMLGGQKLIADRRFLDVLTGSRWPADAQDAIDALARDVAAVVSLDARLAKARTVDDIPASEADTGSAQLVRARLGLPVVG